MLFKINRYCGAKLTAIDTDGVNINQNRLLGQQVITKINGPIVLRFHTDNAMLSKIRQGFRIKFEQSAENCMQHLTNNNNLMLANAYSSSSPVLSSNADRLIGISSPPSLSLKSEKSLNDNLSRFNAKKMSV